MEIEYVFITILFTVFFLLLAIFMIYLITIIWKIGSKPENNPEEFLEEIAKNKDIISKKKRIVFVGDSLTHGNVSVNYINMIRERLGEKKYEYINAGINGELTHNVLQRIEEIIACKPHFIIILIGTNDAKQELLVEHDEASLLQLGLPRAPSHTWFKTNLNEIINKFQEQTKAKIAVCSIPPLGEDINHEGFEQSKKYTNTIKKVANKNNVTYLPVNELMIKFLSEYPSNPKFPLEKSLVRLAAIKHYFSGKSFDEISQENGFSLMVDHIHLNTNGAKLIANLILDFLKKNSS